MKSSIQTFAGADWLLINGAVVILFVAIGLLAWHPGHLHNTQARMPVGNVTSLASVKRLGVREGGWAELKNGPVYPGDFIESDASATASVQFENGTAVALDPSSVVEIVGLGEGQYEVVVHRGRIASSPGLNVRQSDQFELAHVPNANPQLAMPVVPFSPSNP